MPLHIDSVSLPHDAELARSASELADRAAAADGVEAISERFRRGLTEESFGHCHLLARDDDGRVVGLLAAEGSQGELVVAPNARRRGVATALLGASGITEAWAHGDLEPARALARARGWRARRALLVLGVALGDDASAISSRAVLPEGFEALTLEDARGRYGEGHVLDAWLKVNNEAFSWHPEQGGWDRAQLERAMDADWFDPRGVLLLWDVAASQLAGFHWTKWHAAEPLPGAGPGAARDFGEVYVIGLADAYRGRRLGDALLDLGLAYLRGRGAETVILYVEGDNDAALKAYRRAGFEVVERHVVYS